MLTCVVTAHNTSTGGSATSPGLRIPQLCPDPTGAISGTRLGPLSLGLSRTAAHAMLSRFTERSSHTDVFCLTGGAGIRVGYATRTLLAHLSGRPSAQGVILALTANAFYSLHGVRHGMSLASAAARLHLDQPIRWGVNRWYVIPGREANSIIKVRRGIVCEIGIADKRLTASRADQRRLFARF